MQQQQLPRPKPSFDSLPFFQNQYDSREKSMLYRGGCSKLYDSKFVIFVFCLPIRMDNVHFTKTRIEDFSNAHEFQHTNYIFRFRFSSPIRSAPKNAPDLWWTHTNVCARRFRFFVFVIENTIKNLSYTWVCVCTCVRVYVCTFVLYVA